MHALEKEMATHSSILAWRIPGTVEPGGKGVKEERTSGLDLEGCTAYIESDWVSLSGPSLELI